MGFFAHNPPMFAVPRLLPGVFQEQFEDAVSQFRIHFT
jgi:hypothetical protein